MKISLDFISKNTVFYSKGNFMGISYRPLFHLMVERGMIKKDLIEKVGLTSTIVAKFSKNEHVSGETLEKICAYFKCQFSDIMEYVPGK
jgi:DNA-binding Xre family transcriptional regulator